MLIHFLYPQEAVSSPQANTAQTGPDHVSDCIQAAAVLTIRVRITMQQLVLVRSATMPINEVHVTMKLFVLVMSAAMSPNEVL